MCRDEDGGALKQYREGIRAEMDIVGIREEEEKEEEEEEIWSYFRMCKSRDHFCALASLTSWGVEHVSVVVRSFPRPTTHHSMQPHLHPPEAHALPPPSPPPTTLTSAAWNLLTHSHCPSERSSPRQMKTGEEREKAAAIDA